MITRLILATQQVILLFRHRPLLATGLLALGTVLSLATLYLQAILVVIVAGLLYNSTISAILVLMLCVFLADRLKDLIRELLMIPLRNKIFSKLLKSELKRQGFGQPAPPSNEEDSPYIDDSEEEDGSED